MEDLDNPRARCSSVYLMCTVTRVLINRYICNHFISRFISRYICNTKIISIVRWEVLVVGPSSDHITTFLGAQCSPALCRTGQYAATSTEKFGKFSTYVGHNFCQVTHYGMILKRWNIAENNCMVNIHIYNEATDSLEAYFLRFGPKTDFHLSKCKGPEELGKFSY